MHHSSRESSLKPNKTHSIKSIKYTGNDLARTRHSQQKSEVGLSAGGISAASVACCWYENMNGQERCHRLDRDTLSRSRWLVVAGCSMFFGGWWSSGGQKRQARDATLLNHTIGGDRQTRHGTSLRLGFNFDELFARGYAFSSTIHRRMSQDLFRSNCAISSSGVPAL